MTENEATPESANPQPAPGVVDLSDLRMMPSWVASMGSSISNLSKYEEREERGPRRDGDRGDRRGPPRRDGFGGGGGGQGRGGPGPRRDGPGGFGGGPRRDGPPGQGGGPRRDRDDRGGPRRFGDRDRGRDGPRPQREWVEIPKDIAVSIEPEDKSAEALAAHIRSSGHAFSMFDAARLVLAEGDRFHARFTCDAARTAGIFTSTADGGIFLTRDEATSHILRSAALETYYKTEEIELEEPKGDFKSIGVCGMTGELLGPPSHHSFQTSLLRLHRERFSNLPLDEYKRRVKVESNSELVAQWKEKQKKGTRWVYVKEAPAEGQEPTVLNSRAEMEAHFRRFHGEDAVKEVREVVVLGSIDKHKMTHVLFLLLRNAVDAARKHLFEMSQKLGGGFERRGLKLFKRRAGKLFVSRVKPRAVDQGVVFSPRVAKIVDVLKGKSGIILHELVESIAPSAAPPEVVEGQAQVKAPLTDEQISVIKDIRWLANEGYVIEYSDGMVFLGVQGEPHPAKGAAKAPAAEAGETAEASATSEAEAPASESAPAAEETAEAEAPAAEAAPAVTEEAAAETAPTEAPADVVEEAAPAAEAPAEAAAETAPEVEAPAPTASAESDTAEPAPAPAEEPPAA